MPRLTACAYSADARPKVAQSGYGGIKQLIQLLHAPWFGMTDGPVIITLGPWAPSFQSVCCILIPISKYHKYTVLFYSDLSIHWLGHTNVA